MSEQVNPSDTQMCGRVSRRNKQDVAFFVFERRQDCASFGLDRRQDFGQFLGRMFQHPKQAVPLFLGRMLCCRRQDVSQIDGRVSLDGFVPKT